MKLEEKLIESHENLVEGITVLLLQQAVENDIIKPDEDAEPHYRKVKAGVEAWLNSEFRE